MSISGFLDTAGTLLPETLEGLLGSVQGLVPVNVDLLSTGKFLLMFVVVVLGAALLGRIFLGYQSAFNQALAASVEILLVYVLTVVIYIIRPWKLERFLSPLPFLSFCSQALVITPIQGTQWIVLSREILNLVILAFLVNVSNRLFHNGHNPVSWLFSRLLAAGLSMALHLAARWAIGEYLPGVISEYAPALLIGLLLAFLFMGIFKWLLGLFLVSLNPFLGAVYGFFFANRIGRLITMSVLSSAVLCCIFYLLQITGYNVICVTPKDILSYCPLLACLIGIWYLIGHEL